jgi:hypothetical protein
MSIGICIAPEQGGTVPLLQVAGSFQFPLARETYGISELFTPIYKGAAKRSACDKLIRCAPGVVVPF